MVITSVPPTHQAAATTPAWSVVPSPNQGSDILSGVSCTSASFCTAVGNGVTGGGINQTLAESWNGSVWSIVASPNQGSDPILTGVSCVSARSCTSVGYYYDGSYDQTLAESWNGTAWSIVASPNEGTLSDLLNSVSCISASSCIAAGLYLDAQGAPEPLVESWNGSAWSIVASPLAHGVLMSVSCVSAASCTAVGYSNDAVSQTLALSWNGTNWSIVPSPNAELSCCYGSTTQLNSVSCFSAASCVAVGFAYAFDAQVQTVVEFWNGRAWSIVASPNRGSNENTLNGVSCVSVSSCTAVGHYVNDRSVDQTLVEFWNGSAWSIVASPNRGSNENTLVGVSCVSASSCTAVGHYVNDRSVDQTLVQSNATSAAAQLTYTPRIARATGSWLLTVAFSPSATPSSTGRWEESR
jgi:hypothetical protein